MKYSTSTFVSYEVPLYEMHFVSCNSIIQISISTGVSSQKDGLFWLKISCQEILPVQGLLQFAQIPTFKIGRMCNVHCAL